MSLLAARLICAALLCASGFAHSEEFITKVIAVLDGDTVLIRRASGMAKIRLAEIDAPEVGHAGTGGKPPNSQEAQPFGETAKQSLSEMVLGKQVTVVTQTVDQYGRLVAHLSVDGLDVNAEQIRRGMAWEYSNFHGNKALVALQEDARQTQRGLWAQGAAIPPGEWRKQHPSTFAAQPGSTVPSVTTPADKTSADPLCGNNKHCSELSSCEEARHALARCGEKSLDSDGDGTPCEELCGTPANNRGVNRK